MDQLWTRAVDANPSLFDGSVAACASLRWENDQTSKRTLVVHWARTTYRRYKLRRVPGATARLASLYVSVLQPVDEGGLLVGLMSATTAAPGRWQLPGGSVEPPASQGESLDESALRRHAAQELAEEVGVVVAPDTLTLWLVTNVNHANVGVHLLAPSLPLRQLCTSHQELYAAEKARGDEPEFDRVTVVRSPADLATFHGHHADYLPQIVERYHSAN